MNKEVLDLLKYKNRGLEKFLRTSVKFAEAARAGDFSGLDGFQSDRDSIIRAIELFDRRLIERATLMPDAEKTAEFIAAVRECMEREDELKSRIVAADAVVQDLLRMEGDRLLREIHVHRKQFETLEKFKSEPGSSGNGEGLDQTL